jgi:transcriptional regulator with XRE-family HTH domain
MNFSIALKVKSKNGILQNFIEEMGWTQSDFARELEVSSSIVGDWFNMKDYPRSSKRMDRVSVLIGKTPEEIFPNFLKDPAFLRMRKRWTFYREVDLYFFPFEKVPELVYTPEDNAEPFLIALLKI